jgi:hypothetical protein
MVAAPPLMHRKGHAGPRDQQRRQNDHASVKCGAHCNPPSRSPARRSAGELRRADRPFRFHRLSLSRTACLAG